ncbi:Uncharacterized protein ESCO_002233 [Escovopsis weberi]|uniref:RBR-type E3 ubiquitin transferase n=1 Tax=Escovopsis weberi TaxID=150374 RepID=A0A0M8N970_ESCWE|nr:Uncharacterized protein ESCO_002233 [Escovopsis weberi]
MPGPEIDSVSSLSSEEDGSGPASPVTQQPGSFYLIEPALLDGVVDGDLSTLFRNEEEEDDNHDNHDNDDVDDTDDNDYDYVSDFDDDSSDEDNAASGPRECIICCVAKDPEEFPSSPVTKACTHSPRTCFECIETSILADFMSNYWTDIRCPECRELLEQADIDLYADEDTRERYTRLAENAALSQSPNFVLCTYPGCNTGQIHGPGGAAPIVTCTMCDHRMCFRHRSDWHEGFTCEQWDQRREQLKRQMEERQSEWLLATLCKACPGCGWAIEKDQGCSHMTCLSCKYEFCWDCLSPWRRHTVFCGVMMVD